MTLKFFNVSIQTDSVIHYQSDKSGKATAIFSEMFIFEQKIRPYKFLLCLIIFFLFLPQISAKESKLYYVKYNVETENGTFSGSNLSMVPAAKEFRINNFKAIKIKGQSIKDAKTDNISSAKHNAITNLLIRHGLQSITNKKALFNLILREKTVMSYEGVIKHPYKILNQGYLENESAYYIEMEVLFSPISFPDKWSYLYIKQKITNMFTATISIFK